MRNNLGRIEWIVLGIFLLVAAMYFAARLVDIVSEIAIRYPTIGALGWALIVTWFLFGIIAGLLVTGYCKRKGHARACHLEGVAVSALYFFGSFVVYLLFFGNP